MRHLTPTEAARIMFSLIQKLRAETGGGNKLTLANAATMMAVMKNPGLLQNSLIAEVGGIKDSALSRHLDVLEGTVRGKEEGPEAALVVREKNPRYRASNDVHLTEQGRQFAQDFADYFNRLLDQSTKD